MDLKNFIDTRRRGEMDVLLFILVFVAAGVGISLCYSASAVYALRTFGDAFYFLKRQALWLALGCVALFAVQTIDYRWYAKQTKYMLFASFVLLILVLVPGVGHSVKGSARWLSLGFFSIQPAEFVKIFAVIYLVKIFSHDSADNPLVQLLIPICIVAVLFILIMLQPDFGTAMTLLIVSVLILFASGFPLLHIVSLFFISIPMFYLLVYHVQYRKERLLAYFDPWSNRFGVGYHVVQAFIAFKKGGFFGMGLGNGTQKVARLPEPHTDFIFAVIAEETGLLGTTLIVVLYLLIFWRGLVIALTAPDDYSRLLALGLSLFIVVQAFINIGVVTGGLPTTGIPLPFISYGGSSLLANMVAAGILLNISRYREVVERGSIFSQGAVQ